LLITGVSMRRERSDTTNQIMRRLSDSPQIVLGPKTNLARVVDGMMFGEVPASDDLIPPGIKEAVTEAFKRIPGLAHVAVKAVPQSEMDESMGTTMRAPRLAPVRMEPQPGSGIELVEDDESEKAAQEAAAQNRGQRGVTPQMGRMVVPVGVPASAGRAAVGAVIQQRLAFHAVADVGHYTPAESIADAQGVRTATKAEGDKLHRTASEAEADARGVRRASESRADVERSTVTSREAQSDAARGGHGSTPTPRSPGMITPALPDDE